MAQFLYDRHSTNVHLNIVKRHIRLARQAKGAEELVTTIEPLYNELETKASIAEASARETESKRDFLAFKDALLDDKVRDVNEACKKYDRDNPGSSVFNLLFPDGLSPVVYAPIESEPTMVEELILAIQNLGENHLLFGHILPLQAAISESKNAIDELHAAITAKKMADAAVGIAKVNLTRQYEQNIYAANSKFGKTYANRLFPAISAPGKTENGTETNQKAK